MSKVRLHKAIADAGFASRRAGEEWIRGGKVSVNGEVVTEMGVMVNPNSDRSHRRYYPRKSGQEKNLSIL